MRVSVQFRGSTRSFRFEHVLSEANQDLIVLLLYLAVLHDRGEMAPKVAKILLLDDVLQSVDGVIRNRFYKLVMREFRGWQSFFAVTDRADLESLWHAAKAENWTIVRREFATWSLQLGPRIFEPREWSTELLATIDRPDEPYVLSNRAGRDLERLANLCSESLAAAIPRQHGDRYTLAHTWGPVSKQLRKYPSLVPIIQEVEHSVWLRNALGAHDNRWAEHLSRSDGVAFVRAVSALIAAVWCENCRTTLGPSKGDGLGCECGGMHVA